MSTFKRSRRDSHRRKCGLERGEEALNAPFDIDNWPPVEMSPPEFPSEQELADIKARMFEWWDYQQRWETMVGSWLREWSRQ